MRGAEGSALARLDALAPNGFHVQLAATIALGLFGAAVGMGGPGPLALAATLAVGALLGGLIADRLGRRPVILAGMVGTLVGAPLLVLLPAAALLVTAAFGMTAAAGLPLLAESAPKGARSALVSLVAVLTAAGSMIGTFGSPNTALILTFVPALVAILLWRGIAESPRWLQARGRAVDADAVVRRAERAGGAAAITLARVAPGAPLAASPSDLTGRRVLGGLALGLAGGLAAVAYIGLALALALVGGLVAAEAIGTPLRGVGAGLAITATAIGLLIAALLLALPTSAGSAIALVALAIWLAVGRSAQSLPA